jgi:hypothetical protein
MLRRTPKRSSSLDRKQQEVAEAEATLRAQMEKLQQMITEAPRLAQEKSKRQREELLSRASAGGARLDASIALRDKRYGDDTWDERPRRALRKERREGRIVFLVLALALAVAVIWLATHVHF